MLLGGVEMNRQRIMMVLLCAVLCAPALLAGDTGDLLKGDAFYADFGTGFIGVDGDINRVWTNGYEIELNLGYRFVPSIGVEIGCIMGFTSMIDSLKNTVVVSDTYGNIDTRSTWGGLYIGFPVGLVYSWQVPGTTLVLIAGGGGDFAFESETGLDNIDGYTSRGTMGLGYYMQAGVFECEDAVDGAFKYGLRFRIMQNLADVKDFSYLAYNDQSKTTANDIRYMLIFDIGSL
jgi:hypothetical protein